MEIPELVLDSELFKKICSETIFNRDFEELVCSKYSTGEFCPYDVAECFSFRDILTGMKNKKCKLAYNDAIRMECIEIINNCPAEIKIKFNRILSCASCCKNITDDWDYGNRDLFKETSLESKVSYLNVAYFSSRIIVSTKSSVDEICTNLIDKLSIVGISYRNVTSIKEEIDKL